MAAPWLNNLLGPTPAPRVVSVTSKTNPNVPGTPPPLFPGTGSVGGKPGQLGQMGQQGTPFDINALLAKLQSGFDASNNAGLEQYKNLLATVNDTGAKTIGPGGLYDQAQGMMAGAGQTASRNIETGRVRDIASSEQDLTNRGLGNTTIRSSVQRGINSDAQNNQNTAAEAVAQQQANLLTQRAGATTQQGSLTGDAILSKNNQAPETDLYAQLLENLTRYGGGSLTGAAPGGAGAPGTTYGPGGGGVGPVFPGSPGASGGAGGKAPKKIKGSAGGGSTGGKVDTFTNPNGFDASDPGSQIDKIPGTAAGFKATQDTSGASGGNEGMIYVPGGSPVPGGGKGWSGPYDGQGNKTGGSIWGNYWKPPSGYNPANPSGTKPTGS